MSLPTDVVGEDIHASIGPIETTLRIQSFEHEWATVTYKQNLVHVTANASGSAREGGVVSPVQFFITEDEWRRLNRHARNAESRGVEQ